MGIGGYGLRICSGAVLAAVVTTLSGGKEQIRWICGLFLLFLVIAPVRGLDLDLTWELTDQIAAEAECITEQAGHLAQTQVRDGIIERTRTYILDEAESLGAQIRVVALALEEDGFLPVRVELEGEISPYDRRILSEILRDDLGIGKEGQIWRD